MSSREHRSFRDGAVKKPYSPKIPSNKKSSAFSGTPSTHHPVQHRVPHARTRRDRLRELRIRLYYEQRMLRRVFEEWKEEWWVSYREWKLCIRADCHYRYYLYNLMFQAWKSYVHEQHEMRNKYLRAENRDVKQKMRRAWKSWLIYVVFRRTKRQMQTTALEFRQRSLMWVCWSEWKRGLEQIHVCHALHASAVKHRALSLQLQAWSQWQEQLLHVWRERRKLVCAARHHQHWQKWRFLKAWLQYLQVRRVKRQQHEMAERFHHVTVLQTHFCVWQWAWEQRVRLHAHQALVGEVARRMVLRQALTHWKHSRPLHMGHQDGTVWGGNLVVVRVLNSLADVLLCAEAAAQWKVAEEHHRHSLLLLRRFWNLWQSRIEQREAREQLPLLHAAWNHYSMTLLRKCVKLWLQFVQKRRYKQLLQARADGHFQRRALPAAFQAWRTLWQWSQQESVLTARAARFHRPPFTQSGSFCGGPGPRGTSRRRHIAGSGCGKQWPVPTSATGSSAGLSASGGSGPKGAGQSEWLLVPEEFFPSRAALLKQQHCRQKVGSVLAAEFHSARLLRWTWSRWREVLVQWRETVSVQIYYREREACAIRAARKVLESGYLRTWFRRWRARGQRAAQQREQLERAAWHHRRTLLLAAVARWKAYHRGCVRKKLLQRLGTQLRALTLSRSCFHQWKQQLLSRRREQQDTARALWLWSFCLQAKVWAAWLDFVLERRRKKLRLELAAQAYHQQLLREGVACLLRFSAGEKALRQQLHAQQRVQVGGWPPPDLVGSELHTARPDQGPLQAAHSLHRAVRRCATLWKQKVLGPGKKPQPPTPSRRVTFQGALCDDAAAAGDATLETQRLKAARWLWGAQGSLTLVAGTPQLLELPEKHQEHGLGPSLSGPFLAKAQAAPIPSSPLPPTVVLPSLPDLKVHPTASAGPELLPPSCFMPCGKATPARAPLSLVSARSPRLLLPGDFTGTRPAPSSWDPSIQPGPGKKGHDQVHCPVATSHTDVEAELEGIQQQLQHCQTMKQNLWSCQRQARSLRRWLELSREEPRPEDQEAEQLVEKELQEVELQIQQLSAELQAQRQPIRACIARVQALRQALG
ncbi:Protein SFI1 [Galemys pyrenaicus]|uniref:Protein SFI1 n=1 Tax=Galemys pyrenaicus TaxID=202257 RepID=A0A8J6AM62_GALPY|nr:Protein SFI1 [Galemys pyrenaicus]